MKRSPDVRLRNANKNTPKNNGKKKVNIITVMFCFSLFLPNVFTFMFSTDCAKFVI